jgi:Spy/CpxP family protein refolding chaperone
MSRTQLAVVCLPLFAVAPALASDEKPPAPDRKALDRLIQRFSLVVQKDIEEKLNLSDEQKQKLMKIQKELDGLNQKLLIKALGDIAKLQEALDKARNGSDGEPLRISALEFGMLTLEMVKTQREIDTKFREILTDEQKKTYDELKGPRRPRRERRASDG